MWLLSQVGKIQCTCAHLFINESSVPVPAIEDPLELVQPDLGHANQVAGDDSRAVGENMGVLLAENVPNNRARDDLQLTSTLPDLE